MADDDLKKVDVQELQRAEAVAFSEQINNLLRHDDELKALGYIPLSLEDPTKLFSASEDGRLLCRVINAIKPDTIPKKNIKMTVNKANLDKPGCNDAWEIASNNNAVIDAAKKLGCKIVNIGHQDILNGNPDLILGLVWQLIRIMLMRDISLAGHPELIRLLKPNETIDKLLAVSAEEIIMRWFNYHLQQGGYNGTVKNFGKDMADCEKWVVLLKQVAPRLSQEAGIDEVMAIQDPLERANMLLVVAEELDCREFTSAKDIVKGHARLNLAFTATIFNQHIGINLPTEDEIDAIYAELEVLKQQHSTCCAEGAQLQLRVDELEKEQAELKAQVAALEKQLETSEVAVVESTARVDQVTREKNGEISRLKASLAEKDTDYIAKTKELKTLLNEQEIVAAETDALEEMQNAKIAELKTEVDKLTHTRADMQKQLEAKGGDVLAISEKMLSSEALREKRSRAMTEHVKKSTEVLASHAAKLPHAPAIPAVNMADDHKAGLDNLMAQEALLQRYMQELASTENDFVRHKEAEKKRVDEITQSMASFLGEGQSNPEDALNNMKKFLDMLIAKCDKQTMQVKTLEITLEKKKQLNDVYSEKILAIAEEATNRKKKSKK